MHDLKKNLIQSSTLYVVATPIGNLDDISMRALNVVQQVDYVAAEDTRRTGQLLKHYDISNKCFALHKFNEAVTSNKVIKYLSSGKSIALVSDAGTPSISDPGRILVDRVLDSGFRVVSIPGPSSLTAAISICGLVSTQVRFCGFFPVKKGERISELRDMEHYQGLTVFFESPRRILRTLEELRRALGGVRRVAIMKELTKIHEEVFRCRLDEIEKAEESLRGGLRGEFILAVEGHNGKQTSDEAEISRILNILTPKLSLKETVTITAEITGFKRKTIYAKAVSLKKDKVNS